MWAGNVNVLSENFSSNNTIAKLETAGWVFTGSKSIQSGWLQVASGSGKGSATTPAFASLVGSSATLTFDLISASASSKTLTITGKNCKVDGGTSTTKTAPANSGTASSITISITNASTASTIEFSAASSNGCRIDNVVVYYESSTPSSGASFTNSGPSIDWPTHTTYTQTATTAEGYAGTSGASVSYSLSSNSCGASITNATTGEITFTKGGKVTVTATAAAIEGKFTQSTASYTLTVNDVRADADLTWSESSVEIMKDATTYTLPTLTNPHGLTINNYTATGTEGLASVTSAGVVTVNTGTVGTATIKAIFGGNTEYKAQTVSYDIVVVDPTIKGSKYNPYTVAEVIAMNPTATATGENVANQDVYVTGYIVGGFNTSSKFTITASEYQASNLALADSYNETTGTETIPVELKNNTTPRANYNLIDNPTNINATKVLVKADVLKYFTVPGLKNIEEISTSLMRITPAKAMITFCSSNALNFDGSELKAYVVSSIGSKAVLEEVTDVPAGTGLVLVGTANTTYEISGGTATSLGTTNQLIGVKKATNISQSAPTTYDYVLSNGKFVRSEKGTLPAGKAYLPASAFSGGAPSLDVVFSGEDESDNTTGIKSISTSMSKAYGVFNLNGQRISQPTKGLYIVNGRKVVVK